MPDTNTQGVALDPKGLEAACKATILGEDEDGGAVHLEYDEAETAVRAYLSAAQEPNYANLLSVITDIRMKSGVGAKPMLSELADAIGDLRAKVERLERDNETYRTAFDGIEPAAQEGREAVAGELSYGQKLIAEAIEHHFGECIEDYDEDADDTTIRDAWEAFDDLTHPTPAQPSAQVVECARWYVVNDSDWRWDSKASPEGDGAPKFVMALNPQSAAERAVMEWRQEGEVFDGAHLIVALVETVGFAAVETDSAGNDTWEPFCNISGSALASPTDAEAAYFDGLVERAKASAAKASKKFPQPNYVTLKIAEEAGEVVRGAVHYAENRMEWQEVEGEIVQLLAMLIRFVTEGDQINGVIPPLTAAKAGEDGRHG